MPHPSGKSRELTITTLNEVGYGVGQKAGQTLTVARTAPGDVVQTGPPQTKDRWSSAPLVRVLRPGPDRVESGCRAFDDGCGGCAWLHLSYEAQVKTKEKNLQSLLRERAGYRGRFEPLRPMDSPEGYRNKLSLKNEAGRLVFVPEFEGHALAPRDCRVQTPALQAAWSVLRGRRVPAGLEQLHLRSNADGSVGLHAFVRDASSALEAELRALQQACPGSVGVSASSRQGYRVVAGDAVLPQTAAEVTWLVPHNGFYQTNEPQARVLLDTVRSAASVTAGDRLLDLYCGVGFFGLWLAAGAREVVGIEENETSVAAALSSASASAVTNARFVAGDLGPTLAALDRHPSEVAVIDPPREGLLPRALAALLDRAPRRLVYVSCYPPSLARDLKALLAAGWRGVSCTPVELFPHTAHVEVVVTLERATG